MRKRSLAAKCVLYSVSPHLASAALLPVSLLTTPLTLGSGAGLVDQIRPTDAADAMGGSANGYDVTSTATAVAVLNRSVTPVMR